MVPPLCCTDCFKRSFLNPLTPGGKYLLVLAAQLTVTDSGPRCWDNDVNNTDATPALVVKGLIKIVPIYWMSLRYFTNLHVGLFYQIIINSVSRISLNWIVVCMTSCNVKKLMKFFKSFVFTSYFLFYFEHNAYIIIYIIINYIYYNRRIWKMTYDIFFYLTFKLRRRLHS